MLCKAANARVLDVAKLSNGAVSDSLSDTTTTDGTTTASRDTIARAAVGRLPPFNTDITEAMSKSKAVHTFCQSPIVNVTELISLRNLFFEF
jgi:hypothetical protein